MDFGRLVAPRLSLANQDRPDESSKKFKKTRVIFSSKIRARCLFAVGLQYRPYELNLSTLCTILEDYFSPFKNVFGTL